MRRHPTIFAEQQGLRFVLRDGVGDAFDRAGTTSSSSAPSSSAPGLRPSASSSSLSQLAAVPGTSWEKAMQELRQEFGASLCLSRSLAYVRFCVCVCTCSSPCTLVVIAICPVLAVFSFLRLSFSRSRTHTRIQRRSLCSLSSMLPLLISMQLTRVTLCLSVFMCMQWGDWKNLRKRFCILHLSSIITSSLPYNTYTWTV